MADVNRPKIQLRPGLSINGDKTPSPATKLLINHGKPNFTIQKSPKTQNGNTNPLSPPVNANNNNNNNNEFVVKSTTFNGIFKPSNISPAVKQTLPAQNGLSNSNNNNNNAVDNEAAKVVLRRAKVVPTEVKESEGDENVPEFILRQRRIQERLANQNILDFENRRSGYFTQVMISPSSPNRQSFVETMASPAVKPGLEIPPPAPEHQEEVKEVEEVTQEHQEQDQQQEKTDLVEEKHEECVKAEPVTLNGHDAEEEEVAKAIEEVNKAVEGEDDDKTEIEELEEHKQELVEEKQESKQEIHAPVDAVVTSLAVDEEKPKEEETNKEEPAVEPVTAVVTSLAVEEEPIKAEDSTKAEKSSKIDESKTEEAPKVEETVAVTNEVAQQNGHHETEVIVHQTNGIEEPLQNGHSTHEITISHTNGLNSPTIPSPDLKGEKGVNFEPKTVVSFSQELGNDVNKYPDTVKVVKEGQTPEVDPELKELTKLKFEIKADDENIEVKPVLITEPVTN